MWVTMTMTGCLVTAGTLWSSPPSSLMQLFCPGEAELLRVRSWWFDPLPAFPRDHSGSDVQKSAWPWAASSPVFVQCLCSVFTVSSCPCETYLSDMTSMTWIHVTTHNESTACHKAQAHYGLWFQIQQNLIWNNDKKWAEYRWVFGLFQSASESTFLIGNPFYRSPFCVFLLSGLSLIVLFYIVFNLTFNFNFSCVQTAL